MSSRKREFDSVRTLVVLALAWLSGAAPALAQHHELVLHQNLAQLMAEAHVVFHGRVTEVRTEKHPQFTALDTLVVTLEVKEVFYGKAGATYTFRQYLSAQQDVISKLGYQAGQEYVLMLIKPSQYGLSSPAGLEQGRFRVHRDAQGNVQLVNGFGNAGLFYRMEKHVPEGFAAQLDPAVARLLTEPHKGPISIAKFRELIRGLAAARQR